MALLMEGNKSQFGAPEEYFKILAININARYRWTDITIGGYVSKEARDSNCEPTNIEKIRAKWDDEEYAKYFSPESFGETNPTYLISKDMTPEEIEKIVFQNSNIFERAYYYIKDREDAYKAGLNA